MLILVSPYNRFASISQNKEVEIPSLFSAIVGWFDSSFLHDASVQYFDSSCSATYFLFTIGDVKTLTIASQVGGGLTAVSNQCFSTSRINSN